ncbi:efflux RND transporter periplasmic adaptor subunit [Candidatus Parcubacteria bacterium]|nr:efflux RND transporter periplasmic adaptor subunit [Candidatus Parcubacteria bacterium]
MAIKKSVKRIIVILLIILIGGGTAAYFLAGKKNNEEYITEKVKRGTIIQTVNETGAVKAAKEINLNFLNSGRIAKILVKIGDDIEKDKILAELDYSDLNIKKREAAANLNIARANLNKLIAGASKTEIAVSQANVNQAKTSYETSLLELKKIEAVARENIRQAQKTFDDLKFKTDADITTYEQAVTTAMISLGNAKNTYQREIDNYIENALIAVDDKLSIANAALDKIDQIVSDKDAESVFSAQKTEYKTETIDNYNEAKNLLTSVSDNLSYAKSDKSSDKTSELLNSALSVLNKVFAALNSCFSALKNTVTYSSFTQTDLDAYKTSINSQLTLTAAAISNIQASRQNLDDAILDYQTNISNSEENLAKAIINLDSAILTAENNLSSAKILGEQQITASQAKISAALKNLETAESQLKKIGAPARSEDIILARAKIDQAQAAIDSISSQINNSIIKAPISGKVVKIEYEVGEQPGSQPVISLLGKNDFEIEVLISETDITKIDKKDPVKITLDAFGEYESFGGGIYFIEPAETVIQDVIYYKIIIKFNPAQREVKSGMTANVDILTERKLDALIIPARAITEMDFDFQGIEGRSVKVLKNNQIEKRSVGIGLRGDGGMVEVISGLKEGEEVITFISAKK